jgi:hypothetical protein
VTDPELNTEVAHSARVWNYLLGGKDNFAADREAAEYALALMPELVQSARANREFLGRAVRHLAGEAGIRQFLDIGTGLPTADNTHEVAQRLAPESRVVYVDHDPLVLAHARVLLDSSPQGATDFVDAELTDIATIRREAARTLDFEQPIALMLMGILGHVEDDDEALAIVRGLVGLLPSGSYLAFYDGTDTSAKIVEGQKVSSDGGHNYYLRSPERMRASSTASSWSSPGWSPSRGGGRGRAPTASRPIRIRTVASAERPSVLSVFNTLGLFTTKY